jgi:hypothetical protein
MVFGVSLAPDWVRGWYLQTKLDTVAVVTVAVTVGGVDTGSKVA